MSTLFASMELTGLRKAHLQQLLEYVQQREEDGWYSGPRAKFEQRHDELKDAVAWMREVTQFDPWHALKHVQEHGCLDWQDVQDDFLEMRRFARAEVDRLIGNEGGDK